MGCLCHIVERDTQQGKCVPPLLIEPGNWRGGGWMDGWFLGRHWRHDEGATKRHQPTTINRTERAKSSSPINIWRQSICCANEESRYGDYYRNKRSENHHRPRPVDRFHLQSKSQSVSSTSRHRIDGKLGDCGALGWCKFGCSMLKQCQLW